MIRPAVLERNYSYYTRNDSDDGFPESSKLVWSSATEENNQHARYFTPLRCIDKQCIYEV